MKTQGTIAVVVGAIIATAGVYEGAASLGIRLPRPAWNGEVIALDVRGLQWQIESLQRQLNAKRRACRAGDRVACDEARDLATEIATMRRLLKQKRGY